MSNIKISLNASSKKIMNCELKWQGKRLYWDQILGTNLLQKLPGGVFNFFIYLCVIFSWEFSVTITDKYMEKLKTPPGNFCDFLRVSINSPSSQKIALNEVYISRKLRYTRLIVTEEWRSFHATWDRNRMTNRDNLSCLSLWNVHSHIEAIIIFRIAWHITSNTLNRFEWDFLSGFGKNFGLTKFNFFTYLFAVSSREFSVTITDKFY